jgi:hypothetical protein
MNKCRTRTPALVLTAMLITQSTASNAETPTTGSNASLPASTSNAGPPTIGVAASIKPKAEKGDGINFQPLAPGSELHASETVRTGQLGAADLVFIDRSNLTVGPTSEVRLDKFVYDPLGYAGQVIMQAPRGEFRFVTGTQDNGAYQLKTPYGTLRVGGHE